MLSSVDYIVKGLEPYTPAVAKDAAGYAIKTAEGVAKSAYETASSTAKTAEGIANSAYETASSTYAGAGQKVSEVVELGKKSLTSITPDPVLALLNSSMETAAAVRADPIGSVKNYVPDFVIQVGEKTYEIVGSSVDSATTAVGQTSGFVVTKVQGQVDSIMQIPQVESLISELKKLVKKEESMTEEESK